MKNDCVITFEGLNLNHFLNALCRQGVTLKRISRQGKKCILQVDAAHSQKVVAQLKEKCYNILNIRYTGVSFGIRFLKTRYILLLCLLLCVVSVAFLSQICLRVEVRGDFDTDTVIDALKQAGVSVGMRLKNFDPDVVENSVATQLNAMYAVVERRASVIYVNVVKTKQVDEPIDMSRRRDIIASVDGQVVGVLCEQGNLLVKVGDIVRKGDVLIEGVRIFNDGESRDVYALGKVTVRQSAQGSAVFSGFKTEVQPTGNECTNVAVNLFGKEYGKTCDYAEYTKTSSEVRLSPLNVAIIYNTYRETYRVTVACVIGDCLEELKEQAYAEAIKSCKFVPTETEYTVSGNTVTATLYANIDLC